MPIIVNDFTWRQTESAVTLRVPLHGVHPSKADLLSTPSYIKATYGRFFFEAFLLHPIAPEQSVCTKTEHDIVFELIKCEKQWWEQLEMQLSRKEKQDVKLAILDEEFERVRQCDEECRNQRGELKRVAVREMIEFENVERSEIARIKQEEKERALGDLRQLQRDLQPKIIELDSSQSDEEEEQQPQRPPTTRPRKTKTVEQPPPQPLAIPIPLPRATRSLAVSFSPRQFPTPVRESRIDEENEWLRKQAEARRSAGFVSEDLRAEERNPQYLKAMGDEFMKNGNYLGALSAYSFGIQIAPNFVDLRMARSEAHYLHGNYCKSAEDCSQALDLLKPECMSNMKERFYCISRRGKALLHLGYFREGANELMAALRLKPHDDEIQQLIKDTLHRLEHADEIDEHKDDAEGEEGATIV